jgi:hypothetical protein
MHCFAWFLISGSFFFGRYSPWWTLASYDCCPLVPIQWLLCPISNAHYLRSLVLLGRLRCFHPAAIVKSFSTVKAFYGEGPLPHAQPPTWRARVSLFVWIITFDLSGMGDPTSSYATAGIALRIIWPRKLHHYVKAGIPTGGNIWLLLTKILQV